LTVTRVEDLNLYLKSLESYKYVAQNRQKFQDYLKKIDQTIQVLKPRIYNPTLLDFEEKKSRFLKEEMPITDYFDVLVEQAKTSQISFDFYPHLKALKNLKLKEEQINFKTANEEFDLPPKNCTTCS
jgi:hypothetical protein